MTLGIATSGWIGLPAYEQQLVGARNLMHAYETRILFVQVAGGCCLVGALSRRNQSLWCTPVFFGAFPASSVVFSILIFSIAEEFGGRPIAFCITGLILLSPLVWFAIRNHRRRAKTAE
jgi:hypothetical protein